MPTLSARQAGSVVDGERVIGAEEARRDAGGSRYIFAVGRDRGTTTFSGVSGSSVEIIGENRTLTVAGDAFSETFTEYGVRLYRINR